MIWFLVFSCLYSSGLCETKQSRLVHTLQGPVRGYKDPDYGVYSFYGIPYAKAPTGSDRFKAPLPAPVRTETFDALDKEIICPQNNLLFALVIPESKVKQEDCLIANVYVPETNKTNLPVVIIIHGGAYVTGWGNMFTPKKLVQTEKVIAVTFNYRLGVHGFLCLGTKDAPGNAGMRDQVALIRWVKNNIASFGGDPEEIILSGFSGGAALIDLLLLSKMTKGYFKKLIPESGSGLSPFSVQLDPIKNAQTYAKLLKFDNVHDIHALENFFKNASYDIINSAQVANMKDSVTIMAPCVERDIGEERFLDDSPINILKSGKFEKLPTLYGFANMDGLFRLPLFPFWKNEMNTKFSDFLPADLEFKNDNEREKVAAQVKRFYFGDAPVGEGTILKYVDYFTHVLYAYPILRSVKYQVEAGNNKIYLYQYSYAEDSTPVVPYTNVRGANHCAQTFGVLDGFWNDTRVEENDVSKDMLEQKVYMKKIWINFMITGKPIREGSDFPEWPPADTNWSPHMSINRTLQLEGPLLNDRALFWEDIYDKHYRHPIPPILPPEYWERENGKAKPLH